MIRSAPLWKAYFLIRKNRFRKQRKINKIALELMIDKTTAVYLVLVGGYLFASLFIFGDVIKEFEEYFIFMEDNAIRGFWLLLTALPIRYIMKSFREPGVMFSSSEYQLGLLPYNRGKIWLFTLVEKWLRQLIIYLVIAVLVIVITPISSSLVLSYIVLVLVYDIIMSVPQWKLFQMRFLIKLGWLIAVIIINAIGVIIASPIIGLTLAGTLIVINCILLRTLFVHINWSKVTEICDYHIWNMRLIGYASQTKFKKQKKYSIFQNSTKRKEPFYTNKALHFRIWQVYLGKNYELLFQLIGTLLLMLVVLPFINELFFHIGIAIAIYAYASVAASFYSDRFQADILQVLPWDLRSYKKTYFKWVLFGSIILLIPIFIFLGMHMTFWLPFQIALYCSTFLYIYHIKIDKAIVLLAKKTVSFQVHDSISFLLIILIVFSGVYPALTLSFVITLILFKKRSSVFML